MLELIIKRIGTTTKAYKEQNKEELRAYQKNYRLQRKAMESEKEIVEKAIKERRRESTKRIQTK